MENLDARFWLFIVGAITVVITIIGAVVAISRWTGRVDTRPANLESAAKTVAKDIKKILRNVLHVVLRDEMLRARNQDVPGIGGRDGSE